MRSPWFPLAVVVLVLIVLGALYAAGPECKGSTGRYYTPRGDQRCVERTNAWERITGALTG